MFIALKLKYTKVKVGQKWKLDTCNSGTDKAVVVGKCEPGFEVSTNQST